MKRIVAFLAGLMLACIVRADEFSDTMEQVAANTAKIVAAKPKAKTDCGCSSPADCTCTNCSCLACLYWAYDDEGGGYDLCTKTKVVGYLYPSGKYKSREVNVDGGYTTWRNATPPIKPPQQTALIEGAVDALDEVNAARARLGLRAFKRDDGLTLAAMRCSRHRADRGIEGHVNDFAFLPPGCTAGAAGCAAWPASMGWGSCCWQENWEYAGAAYTVGANGLRYMHLFVRNGDGSRVWIAPAGGGPVCRS